jgi:hypothetical protein
MNFKFWERKATTGKAAPQGMLLATSKLAPLTQENARNIMERVPIRWVAEGRLTEADLGLAATTPILGQYAPQFGWPDDWGLYWEYLDAELFIPEVAFSVALHTRLVWKPGFDIETKDEHTRQEFFEKWKKLRLSQRLKGATKNAFIWGNAYMETVDNSDAQWEYGYPAEVTALGMGAPRPLKSWRPATEFYGLKQIDPRTMRVQMNPLKFDVETSDLFIDKYIQRRWAGPLGPSLSGLWGSNVEIDFMPDQILHLRFCKLPDGIYGYSPMLRSNIFALKGYMVMLQYLPAIVQKRADPLLHLKLGGQITGPDEKVSTYLPSKDDFDMWKSNILNRAPAEDIFTDILTSMEEVYKSSGIISGINEYIQVWKERIYMGLGIPPSIVDIMRPGEVKFGDLRMEVMEDAILEYQQEIEFLINDKLLPRLVSGDCEFHFNPITPEDWRANVAPLLDLYRMGVVSGEYVRDRLDMQAEAGKGTLYQQPAVPVAPKTVPSERKRKQAELMQAKKQVLEKIGEVLRKEKD